MAALAGLEAKVQEFQSVGASLLDDWVRKKEGRQLDRQDVERFVADAFEDAMQSANVGQKEARALRDAIGATVERVDPASDAPLHVVLGLLLRGRLEAILDATVLEPLRSAASMFSSDAGSTQQAIEDAPNSEGIED